ncbi:MAG: hypothetical protein KAI17_03305 [Thiotrichaceae bacterium]|nr:hypothetical protein [Thiotrichaceae bacterium]
MATATKRKTVTKRKAAPKRKARAVKRKTPAKKPKPGMSNAGQYPRVAKADFAGPGGTYPVNSKARYEAAIKLVGFIKNPAEKKKVRDKALSIGVRKGFVTAAHAATLRKAAK